MATLLKGTSLTKEFTEFKVGLSDLMKFSSDVKSVLTYGGPDPTNIGDPETAAIVNMAKAALHDRPVSSGRDEYPVSFECTGYGASFTARNGLMFGWRIEEPSSHPHENENTIWQFYIKPDPGTLEQIHKEALRHGWNGVAPSFVS